MLPLDVLQPKIIGWRARYRVDAPGEAIGVASREVRGWSATRTPSVRTLDVSDERHPGSLHHR